MAAFDQRGRTGVKAKRRQRIGAAILLAIVVGGGSPAVAAGQVSKRLERIETASRAEDCKTVVKLGAPMLDSKRGTGLAPALEAWLYDIVVGCEAELDLNDAYYAHALRATAIEEASDYLWRARLAGELLKERHEAAVATVEAMSQGRGAALNDIPAAWMSQLHHKLEDGGKTDQRRRLLKVLIDSYAPEGDHAAIDSFRRSYAILLAEAGKAQEARAIVLGLEAPSSIARASLDSRLRNLLPGEPDVRAATERSLTRNREAIARHPDQLAPLRRAATDLRQLGRPAEALQLLESARARIGDPTAFTDHSEEANWWWNEVAYTHWQLGHYDEAVAAFRKGAETVEGASPNVSQVINLAQLQHSFGHGEEALKTLAVFETSERKASPYGQMALRYNRGCAHAVAKRPGDAAADLAYIRAHAKDAPRMLGSLLLCLGDLDGAAAEFIRRLDDPETRTETLLELSDFEAPPVLVPLDPAAARLPALKARADVKAAIARAGGIRRFRVQADSL